MNYRSNKSYGTSALDRAARSILLAGSLVMSGCIMAAAAETTSLSWMSWFALLPIFVTVRVAVPRLALLYGALWGICLYLFYSATGNSAGFSSFHSFGLLAAVPAIYTYLGARLTRRIGYAPLVLAVGWIIVELTLQPVAIDRGILSGAVGDGNLIRLIGGVLGYVFVAFLIAFVNAQLLSLVDNITLSISDISLDLPILPECRGWIFRASRLCYSVLLISDFPARAPPLKHPVF